MAVEIVNYPYQGNDDKCLVLSNGQWAATGIGTNWRNILIGIRYCVEDYGSNMVAPARFFLGVMSNPVNNANGQLANGYLSANRGHMVGIAIVGGSTYARSTGQVSGFTSMSYDCPFYARKVVGATVTDSTSWTSYIYGAVSSDAFNKRYGLIMQVLKSVVASSYSVTIRMWAPTYRASEQWYGSYWGARGNMPLSGFLQAMTAEFPHNVLASVDGGGHTFNERLNAFNVNESADGPLNAIHVAWGKVSPRIAISDICYAILA